MTKRMYLIGAKNCLEVSDFKLTDVSSKSQMENSGWSFDIEYHNPEKYKKTCGTNNTWYGFTSNWVERERNSKITATFTGSGTATLDYGNCFFDSKHNGKVNVYLNGKLVDVADMSTVSKQITFAFSPMDVLLLSEDTGIIKINSLKMNCKGKTFFHA